MKTAIIAGALIAMSFASTSFADKYHGEATDATKHKNEQSVTVASSSSDHSNSKRLPGRDCKLYNGGIRQYMMPHYEVGNVDRPECIEGTE